MANHNIASVQKRKLRAALIKRFGWQCHYCQRQPERITLDHVQPRSQGGSNAITNLVLSCAPCNTERGCTPYLLFKELKAQQMEYIRNYNVPPLRFPLRAEAHI